MYKKLCLKLGPPGQVDGVHEFLLGPVEADPEDARLDTVALGPRRLHLDPAAAVVGFRRLEDHRLAGTVVDLQARLPDGKIGSLPFLGLGPTSSTLRRGGGRRGAIQEKEGINFCSVA